jgi:carboxypeptidase Q
VPFSVRQFVEICMSTLRHLRPLLAAALLLAPPLANAQEAQEKSADPKPEADPIARIKEEGLERSKVMETLSYLTDVIGPRLTGSPNMKRANEWTRDKLAEWGLKEAHLESWGEFGRGWELKRFSMQVVEPQAIPLIAFPKGWSPGTDGEVVGPVVVFNATKEEDFDRYKGKLQGAIVLMGSKRDLKAWFEPPGQRLTEARLLDLANAPAPRPRAGRGQFGGRRRQGEGPDPFAFLRKRNQFLIDEGAAVLVEPSFRGDGGTLFIGAVNVPPAEDPEKRVRPWDSETPKILPQIVLTLEHFNRLVRMVEAGEEVKVAVDLKVAFQEDDLKGYNTVAEIPGTDPELKDEVVMLGGHMDSWHPGTGATDNGAGVAVCMEAVRILEALDLKPRRTIRIALWSGEEQGLLGSRGYVSEHFGAFENAGSNSEASFFGPAPNAKVETKPEYEKFAGYFNLDNGTGKVRGVYLEGNEAVRPIFREWLAPFKDMGASTLSISPTGGTDHMSFDRIGLPGFQFIQDPVEYETRTHHSNMDVFDRVQADDLKQASVIMAAFVYNAANADEKLPRKPRPGPASSEEAPKPEEKAAAASGD